MYIQCTKKLLTKLEQPYGALPNPPEPFFCWHASFFEDDNGLLYVVMMNDSSEDEIFFEIDSFKDFSKKVVEEIQLDMQDAEASAKEISAYFKTAGPLTFGPTSDRSQVAKLSGLTKRMKEFVFMMESLQDILSDPVRREDLVSAMDEMLDEKRKISSPIMVSENEATPMVALDVALLLSGNKKAMFDNLC